MSWHIDDSCESRLEYLLDKRRNNRCDSQQEERWQEARGKWSDRAYTGRARRDFHSNAMLTTCITARPCEHERQWRT
jgi:hypothetical protein